MQTFHARHALTENGWLQDALVRVDDVSIVSVTPGVRPRPFEARPVDLLVPGMPNAHCHAFQHGIAGLAERASGRDDSFWTWRERMYAAVDALDPAALLHEATRLYRRLRLHGYTSVAEFHYIHRAGGAHAIESAHALVEAARVAGLRLLLLPVLYRQAGFDGGLLSQRQVPFALSLDDYADLLQRLAQLSRAAVAQSLSVGVAPHSLRAVGPEDLARLLELRQAIVPGCPVHIHVSEQVAEVDAARAHLGTTPIDWLCRNAAVDGCWTMIHATHATRDELGELVRRGATVCVCTTTEANLGDGVFDIETWWSLGGGLAIGSDSNVGVDPSEELRWLEYQARQRRQRRSLLVDEDCAHPGTALWRRAVAGGRRSIGQAHAGIAPGAPAELLALSLDDHSLSPDEAMDDFVFSQRTVHPLTGNTRR